MNVKVKRCGVVLFAIMILALGSAETAAAAQSSTQLSRSFEFRYFDNDNKANGQTDFKGDTAVFNTEQRVDFLRNYAEYARYFFDDPQLDKQVITDDEVKTALKKLKPRPLPTIRKRIPLQQWKWIGYRKGEAEEQIKELSTWNDMEGVKVENGSLVFAGEKVKLHRPFPSQNWRFFIQWKARPTKTNARQSFYLSDNEVVAATVGFNENGRIFYCSEQKEFELDPYSADTWYEFKIEADLTRTAGRYNFYVNGSLKADYVNLQNRHDINQINLFSAKATKAAVLDDIWGVGYHPDFVRDRRVRLDTYIVRTFIDEDFSIKPAIDNWYRADYNDSKWLTTEQLPLVIGSERNAGRDIYMRKVVHIGDFKKAFLNIDALDPGGEIYINGEKIARLDRQPTKVDVSHYLKKDSDNLIAVKVNHVPEGYYLKDGHTSNDMYYGWFAAKMSLDLTAKTYVEDVFVYAEDVSGPARMQARIKIKNKDIQPFKGTVIVDFYPWYPEESSASAATAKFPVNIGTGDEEILKQAISVPNPKLWSCDNPNLYKIVVTLEQSGKPIDDYVITSGIRTISQQGGTFRINGKPEMLNGALMMQFLPPLTEMAAWHRCPPNQWVVKQILMVKKMNGNAIRIHVPSCTYSDPRFAEFGDQLGFMYIWVGTGWNRKEWTEGGWRYAARMRLAEQVEEYVTDMKQVRNHPSVIMWEVLDEGVEREHLDGLFEWFYPAIYSTDPSRLFVLLKNYFRDEPIVTKGTYGGILSGYNDWSTLRQWPMRTARDLSGKPYRNKDLLDSKEKAFFDFESGGIIGQPNWNLVKGKPWYHIHGYEWQGYESGPDSSGRGLALDRWGERKALPAYSGYNVPKKQHPIAWEWKPYEKGSIGRGLTFDEWQISQAWQAFAGYETKKKERLFDIDGIVWCSLRGGGNSVTYMKPIIDYHCHAKLAFYTLRTVFQKTLAASSDADVVYGPDDIISPAIINLGDARTVDVKILVSNMNKETVDSKLYSNVKLPAGRTVTSLPDFKPAFPSKGYYVIEYYVTTADG